MSFSSFWWNGASDTGVTEGNSLRLKGNTEYLYGTTLNYNFFTVSMWVKRGDISLPAEQHVDPLFSYEDSTTGNRAGLFFDVDNTLKITNGTTTKQIGTAVYLDCSAWYHIVWYGLSVTGTNQISINGISLGSTGVSTRPGPNNAWEIGRLNSDYFHGYLAEVFIGRPANSDPSEYYGEYNDDNVWVPITPDTSVVGGLVYLEFKDANKGKNSYGAPDFTCVDIVQNGPGSDPTVDAFNDSPYDNYATINQLETSWFFGGGSTVNSQKDANVTSDTSSNNHNRLTLHNHSNTGLHGDSKKYYIEFHNENYAFGWVADRATVNGPGYGYLGSANNKDSIGVFGDGSIYWNNIAYSSIPGLSFGPGDIVGVAWDDSYFWVSVNGTWIDKDPNVDIDGAFLQIPQTTQSITPVLAFNEDAVPNPINLGGQDYAYPAPAGFLPISSRNTGERQVTNGRDHFQAVLGTGDVIRSNAEAAFPSGLWWIKDRTATGVMQMLDAVRGGDDAFQSPGGGTDRPYAAPPSTSNCVAYCWQASDPWTGSGADLASSGLQNLAGGLSMGSFITSGDPTSSIDCGLGTVPDCYMTKVRSSGSMYVYIRHWDWRRFRLDANPASEDVPVNLEPSSNLIYEGTQDLSGVDLTPGLEMMFYAWKEIKGYSSFGVYTGNGQSGIGYGAYVNLGFRPAIVIIKIKNRNDGCFVFDSTRDPQNPVLNSFRTDRNNEESTAVNIDIVSNGFKVRSNSFTVNGNNQEYLYMAWAENPFSGENVSPANAR